MVAVIVTIVVAVVLVVLVVVVAVGVVLGLLWWLLLLVVLVLVLVLVLVFVLVVVVVVVVAAAAAVVVEFPKHGRLVLLQQAVCCQIHRRHLKMKATVLMAVEGRSKGHHLSVGYQTSSWLSSSRSWMPRR